MARGWESKSIEAQQEDAMREKPTAQRLTPEERDRRARRGTLALARARAAADLARASTPAHRGMLEQALAAIDRQLQDG
jgi:hypothetical protein